MRALRISLVLFALMLVMIGVSTYYGRRVCDGLESRVDALPDEPGEQVATQAEELQDHWKKQTPWLRPILNRAVVRAMGDLISDLCIYAAEADNAADYRATREKVLGAIDEMRRSEKATFGLWS